MKLKKIIKYSITAILSLIIILLVYFVSSSIVAQANNTISNFFGYSIAYVPTNSMSPTIEGGSTILFEQKTDYNSLKTGDIVIYHSDEKNMYIVHRIVSGNTEDGFVMQGDNNSVCDTNSDGTLFLLTSSTYIGKYIKTVTVFSINSGISKTLIFISCMIILVLIIASEMLSIMRHKDKEENKTKEIDEEEVKRKLIEEIKNELKDSNKK